MFGNNITSSEIFSIKNVMQEIAQNEIRHASTPTYIAAVVQKVNDDGTVNVYIPPNTSNSVTNLLNKCNEPLSVGDSVEIGTKNGSLTNCWVALKHGTTYPTKGIKNILDEIELIKKEISTGVFEKAYPVGSIYINAENDTSPAILFGIGIWEKLENVFLLGASTTYVAGSTGGEATHTLTIDEIPSHAHTMTSYYDDANYNTGTIPTNNGRYSLPYDAGNITRTHSTNTNGGGKAHNNMPPYKAVHMWKRIS